MSLLEDILYVPIKERTKKVRRPEKQIATNEADIRKLSALLKLTDWQSHLIRLVDIEKQSMNYIAECVGCDRQYIHQEYKRIYDKMVQLQKSA